jgi:predicted HTH transcriptional regulator
VAESVFAEVSAVLDYLMIGRNSTGPVVRYRQLIRSGESNQLEFKSTLRWDLKAGKTNQAVERASLKTIAAFLNAQGGTLLIGIRDDGSVEGIESDRFPNEDKFLLHLWTLIRTSFGRDVSPFIQTALEEADGKTICAVRCNRSLRPVFLRQPGFNEEYYIRLGPASVALDVSEALKYIHDHFPEQRF